MKQWFIAHSWSIVLYLKVQNLHREIRAMKYHLTYVRMDIIKKNTNNKCRRECGERRKDCGERRRTSGFLMRESERKKEINR